MEEVVGQVYTFHSVSRMKEVGYVTPIICLECWKHDKAKTGNLELRDKVIIAKTWLKLEVKDSIIGLSIRILNLLFQSNLSILGQRYVSAKFIPLLKLTAQRKKLCVTEYSLQKLSCFISAIVVKFSPTPTREYTQHFYGYGNRPCVLYNPYKFCVFNDKIDSNFEVELNICWRNCFGR